MKQLFKYINMTLALPVLLLIGGCSDDDFMPAPGVYPEGDTEINVQMDFDPFAASTPVTRGAAGNMMKELDDLCIVAYDMEGNLLKNFPIEITKEANNLKVDSIQRHKEDASNGNTPNGGNAEKWTKRATFKLTIPYGQYYIYGVANLGKDNGTTKTSTYQELMNRLVNRQKTKREDLLNLSYNWDEDNLLNNRQMLGYFANDLNEKSPSTGEKTNDKTVSINRPNLTIHAWLRRCASKITIDFDGSGLRDNIYVYIKRATIHDIPKSCLLGMPNAAGEGELISYKDANYRPNGTNKNVSIEYGKGTDHKQWPRIANGQPHITDNNGKRKDFHNEYAEALYLYENMQGDQGKKDNKEQHPTENGTVIGANEKKDEVPYGSYIEVEAYYDMVSTTHISQGKIIYRFMLGKDVLNNFDVERNHHYKLTMCPRGNGNDVDWHIEYTEDTGFEFRDPYYVSYLYNHESTLRFRYTPPQGLSVKSIDAEIIGNNWWPENGSFSTDDRDRQRTLNSNDADPMLFSSYRNDNKYTTNPSGVALRGKTKYLGNGFLSLRATDITVLNYDHTAINKSGNWYNDDNLSMNDRFFYGLGTFATSDPYAKDNVDQSKRTYYFDSNGSDKSDNTNKGREAYEVQDMGNGSMRFLLPVFTRAKNLVKRTSYTGNNPYEASSRMAYVKVTVHLSDNSTASEILRVEQVPRITNPKGIYRKSRNNESFHVVLTQKTEDNGNTFQPFTSDGPWMAEVLGDPNFITLNGRSTIKGATGENIDFYVHFNRMNRDDKVRNAVIRVRYHNYSCVHLIFVRQGYNPLDICPGSPKWHTTNKITANEEGDDPRDEGSLFRYGNSNNPIDVSSNAYSPVGSAPGINGFILPGKLNIATGKAPGQYAANSKTWSEIDSNDNGFSNTNTALMSDLEKLYRTSHVQHGFGVLYADGATETQFDSENVYGYCRHDTETTQKRGMCGVFFYYWDEENRNDQYNCRNIFMPVGRSGYGHRRNKDRFNNVTGDGVLRYSCGQTGIFKSSIDNATFQLLHWNPLFYDLYMRKGGIYWAKEKAHATEVTGDAASNAVGLDINFFTFDINCITETNVRNRYNASHPYRWDACFIRAVDR